MAAHQALPSLGFSRQEHWSGLPFPSSVHESESEVTQLCPTLSDPMDCSPSGSSVHGIFQARVLEWGAIAFSYVNKRGSQFQAFSSLCYENFSCSIELVQILFNKPMVPNGEGSGTSLQYSCLENPMGGGAWWAAVYGVAKSQTRLSDFTFTFMHRRRKWQPTPVFLPGESQGRGSLVGCRLWGRTELNMTEAT